MALTIKKRLPSAVTSYAGREAVPLSYTPSNRSCGGLDLKAGEVATANIGSEDFTVTGPTDLPKGTLIKVKDLEGLKLIVEQVEN